MYADNAVQTIKSLKTLKNPKISTAYSSFSLIWSSGINHENETEVLTITRNTAGIITARYTCKAPYILLINYNPTITNPGRIQQAYYKTMDVATIKFTLRQ